MIRTETFSLSAIYIYKIDVLAQYYLKMSLAHTYNITRQLLGMQHYGSRLIFSHFHFGILGYCLKLERLSSKLKYKGP